MSIELQESNSETAELWLIDSEMESSVFENKGDNPDAAESYSLPGGSIIEIKGENLNAAQLDSLMSNRTIEDMGDNLESCEEYIDSMHLMLFRTASFNEISKDSTQDLESWLDQRLELGCKNTFAINCPTDQKNYRE